MGHIFAPFYKDATVVGGPLHTGPLFNLNKITLILGGICEKHAFHSCMGRDLL